MQQLQTFFSCVFNAKSWTNEDKLEDGISLVKVTAMQNPCPEQTLNGNKFGDRNE